MNSIFLTVYYEEPYWVGVLERQCEEHLSACRIVFGAEPHDYEIFEFLAENYNSLVFSRPVDNSGRDSKRLNPKRQQRENKKISSARGIGTRSQQALQMEREACKEEVRKRSSAEREALEKEKYELRQLKKKEKHRGH